MSMHTFVIGVSTSVPANTDGILVTSKTVTAYITLEATSVQNAFAKAKYADG